MGVCTTQWNWIPPMALSDTAIRKIKPKDKPNKVADERGIYLLVFSQGGKLWRMKYRFDGKEKIISFGNYPDVPLARARERRDGSRKLLAAGKFRLNPGKPVVPAWNFDRMARALRIRAESLKHVPMEPIDLVVEKQNWAGGMPPASWADHLSPIPALPRLKLRRKPGLSVISGRSGGKW